MKVLEKKDWSWSRVCTCSLCHTKYEGVLSDVKVESHSINGMEWSVYFLICPVCSTHQQVEHEYELSESIGEPVFSEYQRRLIRDGIQEK